jgi:hypothetical protein
MGRTYRLWLSVAPLLFSTAFAAAQTTTPPSSTIEISYIGLKVDRVLPLTYLDQPPADDGLQGAKVALTDNQTTGQFLNQSFHLNEAMVPDAAGAVDAFKARVAAGDKLFVTDLPAPILLQVADLPEAKGVTILDATATDDAVYGDQEMEPHRTSDWRRPGG